MLHRCAATSLQAPELGALSQRSATAAASPSARQPWRARCGRAFGRVELPALHAWALEHVPVHLACAGLACTLLLNAHGATAAAEARGLVGQRCARSRACSPRRRFAYGGRPLPSAVRDETERVLAEELAQRCAHGYARYLFSRLRVAELR